MKLTITECDPGKERKKSDGTSFTIFTCKDSTGVTYQSFEPIPVGEGDYTVTPNANPQYPSRIKPVKAFGGGFKPSPYNQYRIAAMNGAVQMVVAKAVAIDQLTATYKKLLQMMEEA
jgi:hypothetical protein